MGSKWGAGGWKGRREGGRAAACREGCRHGLRLHARPALTCAPCRPSHKWYWYPEMVRDEALLIKQWDSAGELSQSHGRRADAEGSGANCTFSFHSAFELPPGMVRDDAPDRESIEVRTIALFPEDAGSGAQSSGKL